MLGERGTGGICRYLSSIKILKIFQSFVFVLFCHFLAEMLVRSASQSVCFEKIPSS